MMRRVARRATAVATTLRLGWQLRQMPAVRVERLLVYDLSGTTGAGSTRLPRLVSALEHVRQHDLRRFRRLIINVRRAAVFEHLFAPAAYFPDLGLIGIQADVLQQHPTSAIASFLVHEQVHARLWGAGIRDDAAFGRIERRCYLEQLEYARRFDDSRYIVEWLEGVVTSEAWGASKQEEQLRVRDRKLSFLQTGRFPRWAARWFRWMLRPER